MGEGRVNGYVSQAAVHTHDNAFFEADTGTSFNFRELGINGSWQFSPQVRIAAQAVSRRLGDLDDGDPKLDFALLDYHFYSAESSNVGVRVGRTKNAYGIYNQTRDVPHARPGVLVPQAIYFESIRDALLSVDGVNFYADAYRGAGEFAFEVYGGKRKVEGSVVENLMFQADTSGDFGTADVLGGRIGFVPAAVPELELAVSAIDVKMELEDVASFSPLEVGQAFLDIVANPSTAGKYATSATIEPFVQLLSAQYSPQGWVLTAEYLRVDIDLTNVEILGQPQPDNTTKLESYYLQAEWQLNDHLSLLSRYEYLTFDKTDRKGEVYQATTGRNAFTQYTSGITLGGRWYFTPDMSLTAEYGVFEGAASLVGANSVNYDQLDEDWEVFILQFSFHF
ncbi:hypothetical protein GCM10025791_10740 [Halioxenophilus aromaticivorans]|uniref:Uncharacterized protein n=1 Tax=Halioxenophilus aromaticivorans TaxID=1306992 RepID=A0AAV3TZE4_9ALTE